MDDFSNNRSTTGTLELDNPVSAELEITGDVDWFNAGFDAGVTGWVEIRVEALDSGFGTLSNPILRSIFAPNDDGRIVQFVDHDSGTGHDSTLRLLIDSNDFYLAVAGFGGVIGRYQIVAERFGDHADTFDEVPSSILLDQVSTATFETTTDRDIFRTQLLRFNRNYRIDVDVDQFFPGANDWQISVYDQNQVLQHQIQQDSHEASFVFSPQNDGQYFVAIESLGNTNSYTFEIDVVDDEAGSCTGLNCGGQGFRTTLPLTETVLGDIETSTDVDRFIAGARAGGYYILTFAPFDDVNNIALDDYIIHLEQSTAIGTHTLVFTGNTTQQFEVLSQSDEAFEIDVSGGAFADGKFEISFTETPPIVVTPNSHNGLIFLPADGSGSAPLDTLFDQEGVLGNQADSFQIWHQPGNSSVNDTGFLTENGVPRAADQIHTIAGDEFGNWSFSARDTNANTLSGNDEIFVRGEYEGFYTPWVRLNAQLETVDATTQVGPIWTGDVITYSFLTELPDYLSGFSGFTPLSSNYQSLVRAAIAEWDRVGAFRLVESPDAASVDIRIGSAAFSESAYTHAAGPGTNGFAGDILLNTANYVGDFAPGDLLFQRLVRGIGISLGLSDIPDGSITVADSILRTYSVDGFYPYQPMRLDQAFLQDKYGLDPTTNAGDDLYLLQPGNVSTTSLYDAGGFDVVDAGLFQTRIRASIQQGGLIETDDGNLWIGYGTDIERLNGGQGNDRLSGNALDNRVTGRGGNDFIYGLQGDDVLLGGRGDDRYGYRLGDGNDLINEQGHGGRDVLHIQSPLSVGESLLDYENIRFSRDGNDLILDLTLSPQRVINDPSDIGTSEGSIRIRGMNQTNSAVEVLRLDDSRGNLLTPVISLSSIYSRLADGESSFFQASNTRDQWGVVPDFATPF